VLDPIVRTAQENYISLQDVTGQKKVGMSFSGALTCTQSGFKPVTSRSSVVVNSSTPELNPSAQCCPARFFIGDFAS
jgi:hypothetical protein